jgi:hypothetical protein
MERNERASTIVSMILVGTLYVFLLMRLLDWRPPYAIQVLITLILFTWILLGCFLAPKPHTRVAWRLIFLGFLSNQSAVLANRGYMPVVSPWKGWNGEGIWSLATSHTHLLFLCDRFHLGEFGRYSVGDVILVSALFVFIGGYLWERVRQWRTS